MTNIYGIPEANQEIIYISCSCLHNFDLIKKFKTKWLGGPCRGGGGVWWGWVINTTFISKLMTVSHQKVQNITSLPKACQSREIIPSWNQFQEHVLRLPATPTSNTFNFVMMKGKNIQEKIRNIKASMLTFLMVTESEHVTSKLTMLLQMLSSCGLI